MLAQGTLGESLARLDLVELETFIEKLLTGLGPGSKNCPLATLCRSRGLVEGRAAKFLRKTA
jgi:hypothetical protein